MTLEQSTREIKILVIEDDAEVARIVDAFLSTYGYTVAIEGQAQAGIERAKTMKPHLIILSAALPGMDGHRAKEVLKQDPITANIPVVFLADRNMPIDFREDLFVRKPFSCERLLDIVRLVLLSVSK